MIRIHHLTDLHFGIFSKPASHVASSLPKDLGSQTVQNQYVEFLSNLDLEDAPDFIVISGDLTSVGSLADFLLAREFVGRLEETLAKLWEEPHSRARLIIVLGNHDYSYDTVDEGGGREAARKRFVSHFRQYLTPHEEFEGGGLSSSRVYLRTTPRTGPVAFYCIDSCGIAGNLNEQAVEEIRKLIGVKSLSEPEIQQAIKRVTRADPGVVRLEEFRAGLKRAPAIPAGALKICVTHHPLHSAASADIDDYPMLINAGSLLAELAREQVHVVLSGHVHSHDTVLQYPVDGEKFGWGIFSSIGGTFGSHGNMEDCFTSLDFEPLNSAASDTIDGWLCRITKFESENRSIKPAGRLGTIFVERDQQTMNRHLEIHKTRSPKADDPRRDEAQKAHDKLAKFLSSFGAPSTLRSDLVEGLHDWVPDSNRIYAVDVQAFDAWLDPLVFYYFCLQIPRYVSKSLDADKNRWTLRMSPLVFNATQTALKFLKGAQSRTNFKINATNKHDTHIVNWPSWDSKPSVEIARVLLWSKETLCSENGKSFCKMHDALRIPLFYLNPEEDGLEEDDSYSSLLEREQRPHLEEVDEAEWQRQKPSLLFKEENRKVEYIYGLRGETLRGGLYVDLAAEEPEDQPLPFDDPSPINGRFHHRIHFEQLLRHKKLRFASDAIEAYSRRKPR